MEEKLQESMYVTVSSGNYLKSQKISDNEFITNLYKSFTFPQDEYEIGLCQVIYKSVSNVFLGPTSDYTIKVFTDKSKNHSNFSVKNTSSTLYIYVTAFNSDMKLDHVN